MSSLKISPLSPMASGLPVESSVGTSMTDVHTANPILGVNSVKKFHLLSSNEIPSKVAGSSSLFSTDDQKKNIKNIALQAAKGSNTVSNEKKAQGQIIFSGLSLAIGAILAPFTGGLSLIPTAFVVFYGNAAALAMYGGSQFFVDDDKDDKKEEVDPDLPASASPDKCVPSNTLDNKEELQIEPNLTPANHPEELNDNDQTDSAGVRADKINQRIIEDMAKDAEIATPEYLIQREDIATMEHQTQSETVNNNFEWVMLDNAKESDDHTELMNALELASKMPIEDSINYAPSLELLDFSSPVEYLTELDALNIALDPKCVASNAIHLDDNTKIFAIRNIADIQAAKLLQIVPQQKLEAPQKFKFDVKMPNLIINTQGSAGPGSNRLSGVRNNTGNANVRIEPTLSKVSQKPPKLTAQESDFSVTNDSVDSKSNDNNVNNIDKPVASGIEKSAARYTVKMPNLIINTQGSAGPGSNRLSGVRNNTGNANVRIEPTLSKISQKPSALIVQKSDSSVSNDEIDGKKNDNGDKKVVDGVSPKIGRPVQKYMVNMPNSIISTQGHGGLGSNNSAGVRNNIGNRDTRVEPVFSLPSKQSTELTAQMPQSFGPTNTVDGRTNDNDAKKIAKVISPKSENSAPKYAVNMPNSIISTQGSTGPGSNRLSGVRNNTGNANVRIESTLAKSPQKQSELTAQKPDSSVTNDTVSGRKNDNDVNKIANAKLPKIESSARKYTVNIPNSIISTQGSGGLGSNNSAGIRRNIKEIHNENVSKVALSYWKKTGIDQPVLLNIMRNTLVTRPADLTKIDYVMVKGDAS